jgi:small redox-active disulfide protein 2
MEIKVLGSGCKNCLSLETNARAALDALGLEASVDHVRDEVEIASYGVMRTPALVVDDEVVLVGRVASAEHLKELLSARRPAS